MSIVFQFPGTSEDASKVSRLTQQALPTVEVKEFTVQAVRSTDDKGIQIEAGEDDVFEFVMEDESAWFIRADELADKVRQQNRARGIPDSPDALTIPIQFEAASGTRNLLTDAVKQKVMRLYTNWAGGESAKIVAKMIESKLQTGLHALSRDLKLSEPPDPKTKTADPYLLLLHGTGSSTLGSFKDFDTGQKPVWTQIHDLYEGRVLAFEHRSFTESPVQNAIQLLKALPDDISVDMLTHSRGGLIGEVLVRFTASEGLSDDLKKMLEKEEILYEEIKELQKLLAEKKLRIRNFVRVACPAGGTTLLSKRLDIWLNVLLNSLRAIPGFSGNPVYEFLSELVKAVVHQRTQPEVLPGLAAMMPESPLVKLLNYPDYKVDSLLHVVSGDAKAGKLWSKVVTFVGDLFYQQDHDLVVPVSSMRIGIPRVKPVREHFSVEADVNHFRYFINDDSRAAILNALAAPQASGAHFREVEVPVSLTRKVKITPPYKPGRPTVFILPGIMGSHLKRDDQRLWVNYIQIATGALSRLQISEEGISPDGIHDPSYGELAEFLIGKDYNVVPFAYDWRQDLRESARLLEQAVREQLDKNTETVSFIAHSMGGVLLRTMFAQNPTLFEALKKRDKFRALLLGVPLEGSFSVPRVFMGIDSLVKKIALLDLANDKKTLLNYFTQYPGLLQLLPYEERAVSPIFAYWDEQRQKNKNTDLPEISGDSRAYLKGIQQLFSESNDIWDPNVFKYVAGKDWLTPNGFGVKNGRAEFSATLEGDGRVTWASIPKHLESATYYVPATHGDIPAHQKSFQGFLELLETGETAQLSRRKPASRSVVLEDRMPDEDYVEYPTPIDIDDAIGGKRPPAPPKASFTEVKVTLTHGDLAHAQYPLLAGHFKGDAILYAEAVLDKHLDYKLSMRYELGYYADEIGENIIILPKKGLFKGGIVIGLGNFGELTEAGLTKSVRSALVNYLIKRSEEAPGGVNSQEVGVSALLIGSGFGSLLISNTVKALFNAIAGINKQVAAQTTNKLPLIGHLEIIELYRFKAIQCYRLIKQLTQDNKYSAFQLKDSIRKVAGRRDGIPDEVNTDWWHRIKINAGAEPSAFSRASQPIVFTSITDRSRAEEKTLDTNRSVVNSLVKEAARFTTANPKLSKTLFELLIPNEFKTYMAGLRHMVLIVDKETAKYPWELMSSSEKEADQPIAVKAGLLRQLSTSTFRTQVEGAGGQRALVIGDPPLEKKYAQLEGARIEAENISALLKEYGFDVIAHIGPQSRSMDAVTDLMSQPYKILHFAAHGITNEPKTGQTGIVLGPDTVLTASIFKQMRYVPEMVVVNCCSLGEINKELEAHLQAKYEVAAGVGCQLIEMGVKAVILAGWEVEDNAAKRFSELLYEKMLRGESFGNAVLSARSTTYEEYPGSNTWGAYQCYGDPFFTLAKARKKSSSAEETFADAEEVITHLDNFNNRLDTSYKRKADLEARIREIRKLEETLAPFAGDARVLERIAEAYSKAGDLASAIQKYKSLFGAEKAFFSVRAMEQLQNITIRYLEQTFENNEANRQAVRTAMEKSVSVLAHLNEEQPTSERMSLIGSAYKRAFMVLKDIELLKQSETAYQEAYRLHLNNNRGQVHYYPFFNWATVHALLSLKGIDATLDTAPTPAEETQAIEHAMKLEGSEPDFWNKTAMSMAYLLKLIRSENSKDIDEIKRNLITNFEDAWNIEGNPNNAQSHMDQFKFALDALKCAESSASNKRKIAAVEAVLSAIQQKVR